MTRSVPTSPAKNEKQHTKGNASSLPSYLSWTPSSPFPSTNLLKRKMRKKKRTVPKGINRQDLERDLSTQQETHPRPLVKCTSVNRKSMEKLTQVSEVHLVNTLARNTGDIVWDYLLQTKNAFRDNLVTTLESPEMKKKMSNFCSVRVHVLLIPPYIVL